jgi:hypothetical protein
MSTLQDQSLLKIALGMRVYCMRMITMIRIGREVMRGINRRLMNSVDEMISTELIFDVMMRETTRQYLSMPDSEISLCGRTREISIHSMITVVNARMQKISLYSLIRFVTERKGVSRPHSMIMCANAKMTVSKPHSIIVNARRKSVVSKIGPANNIARKKGVESKIGPTNNLRHAMVEFNNDNPRIRGISRLLIVSVCVWRLIV